MAVWLEGKGAERAIGHSGVCNERVMFFGRYSDRSGKSISQLASDYFALIEAEPEEAIELTPRELLAAVLAVKQ